MGPFRYGFLVTLGLFGAAFFYGDGVITPAISVLSAVEGLELVTPAFKPFIVPFSLVIIVGLFVLQRKGTASVGALFGPVMVVWFVVLGVLGLSGIVQHPEVLVAVNPLHGVNFLAENPLLGFSLWARWCCASRAPRPCMPTWGTLASSPFVRVGCIWCCLLWC